MAETLASLALPRLRSAFGGEHQLLMTMTYVELKLCAEDTSQTLDHRGLNLVSRCTVASGPGRDGSGFTVSIQGCQCPDTRCNEKFQTMIAAHKAQSAMAQALFYERKIKLNPPPDVQHDLHLPDEQIRRQLQDGSVPLFQNQDFLHALLRACVCHDCGSCNCLMHKWVVALHREAVMLVVQTHV